MTFVFGFVCGVVALLVLVWWLVPDEPTDLFAVRARQDLADLERRTIQQMIAVDEQERRRAPVSFGSEIVDGSATDLRWRL